MKSIKLISVILVAVILFPMSLISVSAATKQDKIDAVVAEIVAPIEDDWTDFQKVAYLYQWMITSIPEVRREGERDSIYLTLVERRALCHGRTLTFNYLLDEVGIDNKYVRGYAIGSGDNGHAWSLVKVDGGWYHVDTQTSSYDTILMSDNQARTGGFGYKWTFADYPKSPEVSYGGTDERRNGRFTVIGSSIVYRNDNTDEILKYDSTTKKTTTVATNTDGNFDPYGDYVQYTIDGVGTLYNAINDTKIPCGAVGNLTLIEGDTALFVDFEDVDDDGTKDRVFLEVFNVDAQTLIKTEAQTISLTGLIEGIDYVGTHNGTAYFYNSYDFYSYNIESGSFKKLNRPADVVEALYFFDMQYIGDVKIVERKGTFYLSWNIIGPGSSKANDEGIVSSKMRKIK